MVFSQKSSVAYLAAEPQTGTLAITWFAVSLFAVLFALDFDDVATLMRTGTHVSHEQTKRTRAREAIGPVLRHHSPIPNPRERDREREREKELKRQTYIW